MKKITYILLIIFTIFETQNIFAARSKGRFARSSVANTSNSLEFKGNTEIIVDGKKMELDDISNYLAKQKKANKSIVVRSAETNKVLMTINKNVDVNNIRANLINANCQIYTNAEECVNTMTGNITEITTSDNKGGRGIITPNDTITEYCENKVSKYDNFYLIGSKLNTDINCNYTKCEYRGDNTLETSSESDKKYIEEQGKVYQFYFAKNSCNINTDSSYCVYQGVIEACEKEEGSNINTIQKTCGTDNKWGICEVIDCATDFKVTSDKSGCECKNQELNCEITDDFLNASKVIKECNSDKKSYGQCKIKECIDGYQLKNNKCEQIDNYCETNGQSEICTTTDGNTIKERICNNNKWSECNIKDCAGNYVLKKNSEDKNVCSLKTKSCTCLDENADTCTQTLNETMDEETYLECKIEGCKSNYYKYENACVKAGDSCTCSENESDNCAIEIEDNKAVCKIKTETLTCPCVEDQRGHKYEYWDGAECQNAYQQIEKETVSGINFIVSREIEQCTDSNCKYMSQAPYSGICPNYNETKCKDAAISNGTYTNSKTQNGGVLYDRNLTDIFVNNNKEYTCTLKYGETPDKCIECSLNEIICSDEQHLENGECKDNTKTCTCAEEDSNVSECEQTWNNNTWEECKIKRCNSNYYKYENVCVKAEDSCTCSENNSDNCAIEIEDNKAVCKIKTETLTCPCVEDQRGHKYEYWDGAECQNAYQQIEKETVSGINFIVSREIEQCTDSNCKYMSQAPYSGICPNYNETKCKDAAISNGTYTNSKTQNGGVLYDRNLTNIFVNNNKEYTCTLKYKETSDKCIECSLNEIICSDEQHLENGECIDNTKKCTCAKASNASECEQTWNNNKWEEECKIKECNAGYNLNADKCEKETIGESCTEPYFLVYNDKNKFYATGTLKNGKCSNFKSCTLEMIDNRAYSDDLSSFGYKVGNSYTTTDTIGFYPYDIIGLGFVGDPAFWTYRVNPQTGCELVPMRCAKGYSMMRCDYPNSNFLNTSGLGNCSSKTYKDCSSRAITPNDIDYIFAVGFETLQKKEKIEDISTMCVKEGINPDRYDLTNMYNIAKSCVDYSACYITQYGSAERRKVDSGNAVKLSDGKIYTITLDSTNGCSYTECTGILYHNRCVKAGDSCTCPTNSTGKTCKIGLNNNSEAECKIDTCDDDKHLENGECVDNINACRCAIGSNASECAYNTMGVCEIKKCNNGYNLEDNKCEREIIGESCTEPYFLQLNLATGTNDTFYATGTLKNGKCSNFTSCTLELAGNGISFTTSRMNNMLNYGQYSGSKTTSSRVEFEAYTAPVEYADFMWWGFRVNPETGCELVSQKCLSKMDICDIVPTGRGGMCAGEQGSICSSRAISPNNGSDYIFASGHIATVQKLPKLQSDSTDSTIMVDDQCALWTEDGTLIRRLRDDASMLFEDWNNYSFSCGYYDGCYIVNSSNTNVRQKVASGNAVKLSDGKIYTITLDSTNGCSYTECTGILYNNNKCVKAGDSCTCSENNSDNCVIEIENNEAKCKLKQIVCDADKHLENGECKDNTKPCTCAEEASNASECEQVWNNKWEECKIKKCNDGYNLNGDKCEKETRVGQACTKPYFLKFGMDRFDGIGTINANGECSNFTSCELKINQNASTNEQQTVYSYSDNSVSNDVYIRSGLSGNYKNKPITSTQSQLMFETYRIDVSGNTQGAGQNQWGYRVNEETGCEAMVRSSAMSICAETSSIPEYNIIKQYQNPSFLYCVSDAITPNNGIDYIFASGYAKSSDISRSYIDDNTFLQNIDDYAVIDHCSKDETVSYSSYSNWQEVSGLNATGWRKLPFKCNNYNECFVVNYETGKRTKVTSGNAIKLRDGKIYTITLDSTNGCSYTECKGSIENNKCVE